MRQMIDRLKNNNLGDKGRKLYHPFFMRFAVICYEKNIIFLITIVLTAAFVGYIFFDTHTIICQKIYSNRSTELSIDNLMPVNDFDKIKRLSKLQKLGFFRKDVSDIDFLNGLNDLESLYLDIPEVTDFDPISKCENLKFLSV